LEKSKLEKLFFLYTALIFSYLLLPLILLFFKSKRKDSVMVLLAAYGIFAFAFLFVEKIPVRLQFLYAVTYTSIEYLFFTALLFMNIQSKSLRKIMVVLSLGFLIFQIIFFFRGTLGRIDSIPVGIESILLFSYVFFFFYEIMRNPNQTSFSGHPCFWIAIGIMVYLGGSFFLYILANELPEKEYNKYWFVTYIAEIAKNLLFCVAMIMYVPKKNNSSTLSRNSDTIPHLI